MSFAYTSLGSRFTHCCGGRKPLVKINYTKNIASHGKKITLGLQGKR
jgi:hypothetical protein